MTSVERMLAYTKLPSESPAVTNFQAPPSWPDKGKIEFKNMSLRYHENLPYVLKSIPFFFFFFFL